MKKEGNKKKEEYDSLKNAKEKFAEDKRTETERLERGTELLKEENDRLKNEKKKESEDAKKLLEMAKQKFNEETSSLQNIIDNAASEGIRAAEIIEKQDETIDVNYSFILLHISLLL